MAFHKSNLGSFGANLPCDVDGFVPQETNGPWDFNIDHGSERTHDDEGNLTDYGQWWEETGFAEWRDEAIKATKRASEALSKRQRDN